MISVRGILGIGGIPMDRTSASIWLKRHGVPVSKVFGNGGEADAVHLSDLPEQERLAYLRREFDGLHLDPGDYDDAAHAAFLQASPSRRDRA